MKNELKEIGFALLWGSVVGGIVFCLPNIIEWLTNIMGDIPFRFAFPAVVVAFIVYFLRKL